MLKKFAGFGFLILLLSLPLQADHKHHRSRRHNGDSFVGNSFVGNSFVPGYVVVQVGTRYGQGTFVRGLRAAPRYGHQGFYPDNRRRFRQSKNRHYFKRHRHYHYNGFCPY